VPPVRRVSARVPAVVWRISAEVLVALDEHLGPPVDGYVNGTQSWLTDDGPGATTLEWRLHPVAGYRAPDGTSPDDLFEQVVGALASGGDDTLTVGTERRSLDSLWDGLECFPAYGDEMEPATLAQSAAGALAISPTAVGLVDHDRIGLAWERAHGTVSLTEMLLDELAAGPPGETSGGGG
jgi:hypothetical protein